MHQETKYASLDVAYVILLFLLQYLIHAAIFILCLLSPLQIPCISIHFEGCRGGDECCSEGQKCYEGEGDCDTDDECMPGLRCGYNKNYCRIQTGHEWESGDDCCYRQRK